MPTSAAEPLLSVRNLSTRFRTERGTVRAVDGVSFDVAPGETLAIVGESGSGKSVTALSILRLIPDPPGKIESGEILFEGKDLLKLDEPAIRAIRGDRIAMIFQDPLSALNPVQRVGTQIVEMIQAHQSMTKQAAWDKAVDLPFDAVRRFGAAICRSSATVGAGGGATMTCTGVWKDATEENGPVVVGSVARTRQKNCFA